MSAFGSLFSSRYLVYDPSGLPGVFFDVYTGVLAATMLASIYVYVRRRPLSRGVTPRRHLFRNTAQSFMWISGIGLFFCVMRYVEFMYLDVRIIAYLVVLGAIAYLGYLTYFLSERYPIQVFQFKQLDVDRRFRTAVKRRPQPVAASTGRTGIQRGKRRR